MIVLSRLELGTYSSQGRLQSPVLCHNMERYPNSSLPTEDVMCLATEYLGESKDDVVPLRGGSVNETCQIIELVGSGRLNPKSATAGMRLNGTSKKGKERNEGFDSC